MRIGILDHDSHHLSQLEALFKKRLSSDAEEVACVTFSDGFELQRILCRETFDLLVLEWVGSDGKGPEILRWLRRSRRDPVPVVVLGLRASEYEIARALDCGADDYVAKPIRPVELCARVQRLIERNLGHGMAEHLKFGKWELDRATQSVLGHDPSNLNRTCRRYVLTGCEFEIAMTFFRNIGRVLSRTHLQESIGYVNDATNSRALDSHISRLRHKLRFEEAHGLTLQTVYGRGYRLDVSHLEKHLQNIEFESVSA